MDSTVLTLVKADMLRLKIVCLAALGFVLLFVLPSLGSPSIGDPNTYATSDSSNETIIDEPQPGTIMVTKRVINEGGGWTFALDYVRRGEGIYDPTELEYEYVPDTGELKRAPPLKIQAYLNSRIDHGSVRSLPPHLI